jgi:hypothetical protein
MGGTRWTLVRDDGATSFAAARGDDANGRSVVYANAYVWSPADQTVRLSWMVSTCAGMALLLNGQTVSGDPQLHAAADGEMSAESAWVRLAYGWNTVLAKVSTDCAARFGARLEESWPEEAVPAWPEGIRVQASRPPGDLRTGLEPWVVLSRAVGPLPYLDWTGRHLTGDLRLRLTAWGAPPPDSVRIKSRTEGSEAEMVIAPESPSTSNDKLVEIEFARLRKAGVKRGAARVELRWPDEKLEMNLDVPAVNVLSAFHGPIYLRGWGPGPDDPGPESGTQDGLPRAGRVLRGSWIVPEALEGFSLLLDVADSPGAYSLELQKIDMTGGTAELCSPCRKGEMIDLFVTLSEDWSGWPVARISDPGYPGAGREASDDNSAAEWLSLLDDKGSGKYRERGLEAAD